MQREITVAAAILMDSSERMLVVRKKGSRYFMQPGGKIDAGETPVQALHRELLEEIAVGVEPEDMTFRGIFREQAANEPDTTVVAHVFSARIDASIRPQAEIEEALWLSLDGTKPDIDLAMLTENLLLPLAVRLASGKRPEMVA